MTDRNIKLFYLLEAFVALFGGIILPVYVLYFRCFEITLFQVALLAVVFEATIILFELPTGMIADRYGRKLSTNLGFLAVAVSGLIFFFFRSFTGFLIAEIIFGVAEAFISGALEALAVDSLSETEKKEQLPRLFANRTAWRNTALLVGMIAGGLLAGAFLPWLFVPVILIGLAGFLISLALKESRQSTPDESGEKSIRLPPIRILMKSRTLMALFSVGLLSNLAYEGADQYWQVLFSEIRGIETSAFGLMTGLGLILVIVTVKLTQRLYDRLSLYLLVAFVLMAAALLVAAVGTVYPAIAGIILYFALKELIRPAVSAHLNRMVTSERRATMLSGYNLTCSVGEVAAGICVGILAAHYGVIYIFFFAAIGALAVLAVYHIILLVGEKRYRHPPA